MAFLGLVFALREPQGANKRGKKRYKNTLCYNSFSPFFLNLFWVRWPAIAIWLLRLAKTNLQWLHARERETGLKKTGCNTIEAVGLGFCG